MPAQRKSAKILERTGAFRKNPDRKRKDVAGRGELPTAPPRSLRKVPGATAAWREIVEAIPEGLATGSDKFTVERCAILLARSRVTGLLTAAEESQLRAYLNSLGLGIAARAALGGGGSKEPVNPFGGIGAPVTPIRGR